MSKLKYLLSNFYIIIIYIYLALLVNFGEYLPKSFFHNVFMSQLHDFNNILFVINFGFFIFFIKLCIEAYFIEFKKYNIVAWIHFLFALILIFILFLIGDPKTNENINFCLLTLWFLLFLMPIIFVTFIFRIIIILFNKYKKN